MGGTIVKLKSLKIEKLYGCYSYNINFNSDVTLLYGNNGCGKTTILNITEAIITGQLFKLFNFKFESIELNYVKSKTPNEVNTIRIKSKPSTILILFNRIEREIRLDSDVRTLKKEEFIHYYFSRYDFLSEIRDTFNYVFLPLNRTYVPYKESYEYYYPRFSNRKLIEDDINIPGDDVRDGAMIKIESLIYQHYSRTNVIINGINDSFRNEILKSQIEINNTFNFGEFVTSINSYNFSELKRIQNSYIKILKELKLITLKEEQNINEFFNDIIYCIDNIKDDIDSNEFAMLLLKFHEIMKIQKTINMAKKMEKRKALVTKPIETFLNTINSFIENSDEKKEICINSDGQIFFRTKYNQKISIQHLSSGEKQLITFFANLIFMVEDNSSGIFVVDEPELSLHLSWQKIFIDKVLEINKNIQLIFATHAPEIIGGRRSKMFKLEKYYIEAD